MYPPSRVGARAVARPAATTDGWAGAQLLVSSTASPSFKETTSSSLPSPASPLCLPLPPIHTQPSLSGCISILAALLSPDQTSGVQQQVSHGVGEWGGWDWEPTLQQEDDYNHDMTSWSPLYIF